MNALNVRDGSDILISCADDCSIYMIDLVSYRQELLWKANYELKKIMFLGNNNCIVTSDSIGNVYFIGCLESKFKHKLILQK